MPEQHKLYQFSPSVPAAAVAVIVFTILLCVHLFRLFKTKTWFCIPFVVGAIFEIIGYAGRAYGHYHPQLLGPYIMQYLLILLAPILFAASVYMVLGRIIRATGFASYSLVRTTWLTKIFVGGDIVCFLIQAMGGSMIAGTKDPSARDRGKLIILLGLVLQVVIFGFFMLVGVVFHVRMRKREGGRSAFSDFNWERYLGMLYVASVLITVRNVFRVVEYAMGENGPLLATEWPIYVFDALLMAAVLVICSFWYLGRMVSKDNGLEDHEMMVDGEIRGQSGH
ncbi:RTA1-domain-containing protein [Lindgomyces ingoldianus]|uniref:RTA1-domain-containing protein n=1 Tax=Lindgomyces ingoldianus TaxID=673940 RepID=A0ACB6QY11_9PLEO|nr:RTA1-domain-containing protein [Lindgomyces ingoldianus]KAF2471750.1 RTA1-domain-containing protein [Lindgomyces ingoldianus]